MTAYAATTANGTVATGTSDGNPIFIAACDSSVFAGARVVCKITDGALTYSLDGRPTGSGTLTSAGDTTVNPKSGLTWTVAIEGATASTSIDLIVA